MHGGVHIICRKISKKKKITSINVLYPKFRNLFVIVRSTFSYGRIRVYRLTKRTIILLSIPSPVHLIYIIILLIGVRFGYAVTQPTGKLYCNIYDNTHTVRFIYHEVAIIHGSFEYIFFGCYCVWSHFTTDDHMFAIRSKRYTVIP